MRTPVLINPQGETAKPLSPEWLVCHAENFPKIIMQFSAQFSKRNWEQKKTTKNLAYGTTFT